MSGKLILRSKNSPYTGQFVDINKGSVLSNTNVDDNFIYLKGELIYSGTTSGTILTLNKIDGNQIDVDLTALISSADNYTTGTTVVGDTIYFDRTDSLSAYTLTLNPDTGLTVNKTIYVDAQGDDGTGSRESDTFPFLTIPAAEAVALAGDLIVVRPGTYTLTQSIGKDGIKYFFHPGAIVDGAVTAFGDSGSAMTYSVYGYVTISTSTDISTNVACRYTGEGSNIYLEFDTVTNPALDGFAIFFANSTGTFSNITIRGNEANCPDALYTVNVRGNTNWDFELKKAAVSGNNGLFFRSSPAGVCVMKAPSFTTTGLKDVGMLAALRVEGTSTLDLTIIGDLVGLSGTSAISASVDGTIKVVNGLMSSETIDAVTIGSACNFRAENSKFEALTSGQSGVSNATTGEIVLDKCIINSSGDSITSTVVKNVTCINSAASTAVNGNITVLGIPLVVDGNIK